MSTDFGTIEIFYLTLFSVYLCVFLLILKHAVENPHLANFFAGMGVILLADDFSDLLKTFYWELRIA